MGSQPPIAFFLETLLFSICSLSTHKLTIKHLICESLRLMVFLACFGVVVSTLRGIQLVSVAPRIKSGKLTF